MDRGPLATSDRQSAVRRSTRDPVNGSMRTSSTKPLVPKLDETPFQITGTFNDAQVSRSSKRSSVFRSSKPRSRAEGSTINVDPFASMGTGLQGYIPPLSESDSSATSEDYFTASSTPPRFSYPRPLSHRNEAPVTRIASHAADTSSNRVLRKISPAPTNTGLQTPPASAKRTSRGSMSLKTLIKQEEVTQATASTRESIRQAFAEAPTIALPAGRLTSSSGSRQSRSSIAVSTGLKTPPASDKKISSRGFGLFDRGFPKEEGDGFPPTPAPTIALPTGGLTSSSGSRQSRSSVAVSTGLQTPLASDKKIPSRSFGLFDRGFPKEEEDDGFPPTPTKAPSKKKSTAVKRQQEGLRNTFRVESLETSARNSLASFTNSIPKGRSTSRVSVKPEYNDTILTTPIKRETRKSEPVDQFRPQLTNSIWGLETSEPSPVKLEPAHHTISSVPLVFKKPVLHSSELSALSTPFESDEPKIEKVKKRSGTFETLPIKLVPLVRLASKEVEFDGQPFITYTTDSGDELKWYQALDTEKLVGETVTREVMRMKNDSFLEDVPQGRILNYEMGLGKTHVALCVVAETFKQLDLLYADHDPKPPRRPVLVVADKALHQQWVNHASKLFGLKAVIYSVRGQRLQTNVDIIIANIHIIRNQHGRALDYGDSEVWNPAVDAPFYETTFTYLVIGINPQTISATALLSLKADNVLLLSGTPAQNKVDDLQVPLGLLQHHSQRKDFRELERDARKLKAKLTADEVIHHHFLTETLIEQTIITRRVEGIEGQGPTISLPRENLLVKVPLLPRERDAYHLVSQNYRKVLVRFLRWRQGCLHPKLIPNALQVVSGKSDSDPDVKMEDVTVNFCDIDMEAKEEGLPELTPTTGDVEEEIRSDKYLSSKFRVTLGILRDIDKKGEKTLIFIKQRDRERALSTIATDDSYRVMLISIKAGGTGLNIPCCNNVIILDPWWNPYVEEQAIARVHRLGQTRPVTVFRLISPDTIEDRIREIQDQKRTEIEALTKNCVANTAMQDAAKVARPLK
ncbi:P-loop containing nucleoside triphosphate hydrolase protein [Cyathus striatus]|nr:P-loop containing nucleoside triphosphate hydrolase protein [Cyathus striatus]